MSLGELSGAESSLDCHPVATDLLAQVRGGFPTFVDCLLAPRDDSRPYLLGAQGLMAQGFFGAHGFFMAHGLADGLNVFWSSTV